MARGCAVFMAPSASLCPCTRLRNARMPAGTRLLRIGESPLVARRNIARLLAVLAAALATLTARGDDAAPAPGSPAWNDLLTKLMKPAPGAQPALPDAEPPADSSARPPGDTSARLDENRIVATET